MKRVYILVFFLVLVGSLSAQVKTKLNGFKNIRVFGKMEVRLVYGEKESITIKSEDFDVKRIKFAVNDSVLEISSVESLTKGARIYVEVTYVRVHQIICDAGAKVHNKGELVSPKLKLIVKSGGDAYLQINSDSLFVRANKGGFVKLEGRADFVNLNVNTGGGYQGLKLDNKVTIAKLNTGMAELNTTDYIDATVNFGASLRYINEPKKIKKVEMLKGTVTSMEDIEND